MDWSKQILNPFIQISTHPWHVNTHVGKSLGSTRLQIDSIIGKDGWDIAALANNPPNVLMLWLKLEGISDTFRASDEFIESSSGAAQTCDPCWFSPSFSTLLMTPLFLNLGPILHLCMYLFLPICAPSVSFLIWYYSSLLAPEDHTDGVPGSPADKSTVFPSPSVIFPTTNQKTVTLAPNFNRDGDDYIIVSVLVHFCFRNEYIKGKSQTPVKRCTC